VALARLDPSVSSLKFARELKRLKEQKASLEARGIFLLGEPEYPIVELAYVPRRPLQVAVQVQQPNTIVLPAGTVPVAMAAVPALAARAFKARFDLADYDLRAPSLEFRDLWTDELLKYDTMFRALEYQKERQAHLVLLGDHPTTHKPFLCLRGFREYHEHPQHSGDDWLLYRNELGLFAATMALWRVSIDLAQPTLLPHPTGLQVNWAAEAKD
jgi:hypothetical protein